MTGQFREDFLAGYPAGPEMTGAPHELEKLRLIAEAASAAVGPNGGNSADWTVTGAEFARTQYESAVTGAQEFPGGEHEPPDLQTRRLRRLEVARTLLPIADAALKGHRLEVEERLGPQTDHLAIDGRYAAGARLAVSRWMKAQARLSAAEQEIWWAEQQKESFQD